MSDESVTRDLFDRWELVWHEDRYDLVSSCVGPTYVRHEAAGDRIVTADSYAAELAKMKTERPGVRVAVYDHMFVGNRAWFRFTFKWQDPKTGNPLTQAGMQSYRIEDGKLAETWIVLQPLGSAWPDAVAQERWTSPPPRSNADTIGG
ncbi:MAG: nuclear transport factor 2 family protein [Pseudomonadota bacterium]